MQINTHILKVILIILTLSSVFIIPLACVKYYSYSHDYIVEIHYIDKTSEKRTIHVDKTHHKTNLIKLEEGCLWVITKGNVVCHVKHFKILKHTKND